MARVIVLDASFIIASLSAADAHHPVAKRFLASAADPDFVVAATTRAESLIGPMRSHGRALSVARDFLDACVTVPVTGSIADRAAHLRSKHFALSLPDAIALAVADAIDATDVWTFDGRWATVDARVVVPT